MNNYQTVCEAINDRIKRGYTHDFNVHLEKECLVCNSSLKQLSPNEFEIDETYRFEENTDPADEMIRFAISSKKHKIISGLFCNTSQIEISIKQIQVDLEKHIRFEERILFDKIQNAASPENMEEIKKLHSNEKFVENATDVCWE